MCSWYLVDAGFFGTGLEKSLTLGKELFLNAFSKDPEINAYMLTTVLVDLSPERTVLSLLYAVFSAFYQSGTDGITRIYKRKQ